MTHITSLDLDDYLLPDWQTLEEMDLELSANDDGFQAGHQPDDDDEAYFQQPEIAARWMEDASHRFIRR